VPEQEQKEKSSLYKAASKAVDEWLEMHKGETFDLDTICRQLSIDEAEKRNLITIKLSYLVKHNILDKNNKIYRYIDTSVKDINWLDANENESLTIKWPYGVEDNSRFGFDGCSVVSPGDVIIIAGTSNMGKTTFCMNFLWENMDTFPCTLMGNEYTPVKFKRRAMRMNWKSPTNGDGRPKFELIERHDNWKDIVRPDNINIIDWINLEDNFYRIGSIIEGIQSKLNKGIALISIQKDANKQFGLGGGFSQHLASLYLTVDYQRMTVMKAKEWFNHDPNNQIYGFEIVNYGTKFNRIREIKKCKRCFGTGKKGGSECDECHGTGFVDVNDIPGYGGR
jgi:hypothetical protein